MDTLKGFIMPQDRTKRGHAFEILLIQKILKKAFILKREEVARDLDVDGIVYGTATDFKPEMKEFADKIGLEVKLVRWQEISKKAKKEVFFNAKIKETYLREKYRKFDLYANCFLRPYWKIDGDGEDSFLDAVEGKHLKIMSKITLAPILEDFIPVPDALELWLRRFPKISEGLGQICVSEVGYEKDKLTIIPKREGRFLSVFEAWLLEDLMRGYAARVYSAVWKTAKALFELGGRAEIDGIQQKIWEMGETTGKAGVRDSLKSLEIFQLVEKVANSYVFTPLGWKYCERGKTNHKLFRDLLLNYQPFAYLVKLLIDKGPLKVDEAVDFFKDEYKNFEPYAISKFNPNKTYGLLNLGSAREIGILVKEKGKYMVGKEFSREKKEVGIRI